MGRFLSTESRLASDTIELARDVRAIQWSDDAGVLWDEMYTALGEGETGLVGALLARAEAQIVRLACIFALLDVTDVIQPQHLRAAMAVWEYLR